MEKKRGIKVEHRGGNDVLSRHDARGVNKSGGREDLCLTTPASSAVKSTPGFTLDNLEQMQTHIPVVVIVNVSVMYGALSRSIGPMLIYKLIIVSSRRIYFLTSMGC